MSAFGAAVSNFAKNFTPGEPIQPQGQAVSDFVHETHIPGNPVTPQGQLVSAFIHSYPGDPSLQFGQAVSDFVHEVHLPTTNFDLLL
jgi:hypothetical protein